MSKSKRQPATKSTPASTRKLSTVTSGRSTTSKARSGTPSAKVTSDRQAAFTAPTLSGASGSFVASILQERLYAAIDLALTLKHIHWNVVGPHFIGVHEMLDPQHAGVSAMVDEIAERIATLGASPSGLPGRLVAARTWDDYALDRGDSIAHLGALDLVYLGVIIDHRTAIDSVGEIDKISEDLLIGHTRELEKFQWFVRSHLADSAGGIANAGYTDELGAAGAVLLRSKG